jgi:Toxin PAAR-like domain
MSQNTYVNKRGIAHQGSGGMSAVFPDVCKTPSPGGPIPIPYPNIGKSSDTSKGPKKVKSDEKMPMVKGAQYRMTSGDEAGTAGGGVISNKIKGPAEFMMYSFDVKFEGKNVCRMGDPLFHNKKNIMG